MKDLGIVIKDVMFAEDKEQALAKMIARVVDRIAKTAPKLEAAITAMFAIKNMAEGGFNAAGIMQVLNQVMIAVTGEPMTSKNNPITKWVREAISDLLQSVFGIDLDTLLDIPNELKAMARNATRTLIKSADLTPLLEKAQVAQVHLGKVRSRVRQVQALSQLATEKKLVVENVLEKAKAMKAMMEQMQEMSQALALPDASTLTDLQGVAAGVAGDAMDTVSSAASETAGRRLQTAGTAAATDAQALVTAGVKGMFTAAVDPFVAQLLSLAESRFSDPSQLQTMLSANDAQGQLDLAADIDTVLPMLSKVKANFDMINGFLDPLISKRDELTQHLSMVRTTMDSMDGWQSQLKDVMDAKNALPMDDLQQLLAETIGAEQAAAAQQQSTGRRLQIISPLDGAMEQLDSRIDEVTGGLEKQINDMVSNFVTPLTESFANNQALKSLNKQLPGLLAVLHDVDGVLKIAKGFTNVSALVEKVRNETGVIRA
eukprot:COSAG05_NODE_1030_length_6093_cov_3.047881_4_plen_487_part_00